MTKHKKGSFELFRRGLFALPVAMAIFAGAISTGDARTVTTPGGTFPAATYRGVAKGDLTAFLGIRYAAAPTGALRFAPPTAPASVSGTIAATDLGPSCPQTASSLGVASTVVDEDCLFLNVYVPGASVSNKNKLPVMVYFHGGFFVYGEGSLYDPADMAIQGNTIVVTVNYRLGILGYLADAALSAQAINGVSGNYGFQDQLFALKWVQGNIGNFGGNEQNVTIFGQSAGGYSVCAAVVSPYGRGLFQRAITESGPCGAPLPTQAVAEALGATIVSDLGCKEGPDSVACLRSLSVDAILKEQNLVFSTSNLSSLLDFYPNVDGVLIPQQPISVLASGHYNHVPVIEGTNHDEGRFFVALLADLNPEVGPLTSIDYSLAVGSFAAILVTAESGIAPPPASLVPGAADHRRDFERILGHQLLQCRRGAERRRR
jgi:para-nitrobenzyl esterase